MAVDLLGPCSLLAKTKNGSRILHVPSFSQARLKASIPMEFSIKKLLLLNPVYSHQKPRMGLCRCYGAPKVDEAFSKTCATAS